MLNRADAAPAYHTMGDHRTMDRLDQSLCRACDFLRMQLEAGRDTLAIFATDGSACPITGLGRMFTGFWLTRALLGRLSPHEHQAVISRILHEQRNLMWGDCLEAPVDADDTAFALRTLHQLDAPFSDRGLLSFYQNETRLFPTFQTRTLCRLVTSVAPLNNLQAHPEVLANIYACLWDRNRRAYIDAEIIESAQNKSGDWPSYFYPSRYYATYLYLELLARMNRCLASVARAIRFLSDTQQACGAWGHPLCPYETALAVNGLLCHSGGLPKGEASIRYLLDTQLCDGSWRTDRVIWFYRMSDSVDWEACDIHRVAVTAICVIALTKFKQRLNSGFE